MDLLRATLALSIAATMLGCAAAPGRDSAPTSESSLLAGGACPAAATACPPALPMTSPTSA